MTQVGRRCVWSHGGQGRRGPGGHVHRDGEKPEIMRPEGGVGWPLPSLLVPSPNFVSCPSGGPLDEDSTCKMIWAENQSHVDQTTRYSSPRHPHLKVCTAFHPQMSHSHTWRSVPCFCNLPFLLSQSPSHTFWALIAMCSLLVLSRQQMEKG